MWADGEVHFGRIRRPRSPVVGHLDHPSGSNRLRNGTRVTRGRFGCVVPRAVRVVRIDLVARSLYKGEPLGKLPPCAICVGAGRGARAELHLPGGVSVWLCADHRSEEFLCRRAGRDLVVSLMGVWRGAGCFTARRSRALDLHRARLRTGRTARDLPGSYAWPDLRREAEALFAAGHRPAAVITRLRERERRGPARPPSVRTMRRWFRDGRWLTGPPDPPSQPPPPSGSPPPPAPPPGDPGGRTGVSGPSGTGPGSPSPASRRGTPAQSRSLLAPRADPVTGRPPLAPTSPSTPQGRDRTRLPTSRPARPRPFSPRKQFLSSHAASTGSRCPPAGAGLSL